MSSFTKPGIPEEDLDATNTTMSSSICSERSDPGVRPPVRISKVTFEDQHRPNSDPTDYYLQGSQELATETALILSRLEARRTLTKNCERLVLVLVGLPARGKSFLGRKLTGFLNWHGVPCQVFNVGKYRRQVESGAKAGADFFDAKNAQAAALREKAAEMALQDMLKWLDNEEEEEDEAQGMPWSKQINPECFRSERYTRHEVLSAEEFRTVATKEHAFAKKERIAIFDATNSTDKRREWILEKCNSHAPKVGCVFIESLCDDEELLLENFHEKIANSPDYDGMPKAEAIADLQKRVQKYEEQYETITNDALSYIKIYNLSSKMLVNHIYGRMSKIIMPAMMAWNIGTRPIFLCRPGQTLGNITTDGEDYVAKVDPKQMLQVLDLSRKSQAKFLRGYHLGEAGQQFRQALLEFTQQEGSEFCRKRAHVMNSEDEEDNSSFPLQIYTSTMPRATETVRWEDMSLEMEEVSNLNPLDKGDFAGKELEDIRKLNPTFYQQLIQDPFHTRFPGGESYCDLIKRLDSVIVDLEQQVTPTLVVSHMSVLQMLVAYFRNSPVEHCMDIDIPLHTVLKFTPARGGGWSESIHCLAPPQQQSPRKVNDIVAEGPTGPPEQAKKSSTSSLFRKIFGGKHEHVFTPANNNVLDEPIHRGKPVQS